VVRPLRSGPPCAASGRPSFTANKLLNIEAPINGFLTALDLDHLGIFGHSYGRAVAGSSAR
jgi:hypothetical protein